MLVTFPNHLSKIVIFCYQLCYSPLFSLIYAYFLKLLTSVYNLYEPIDTLKIFHIPDGSTVNIRPVFFHLFSLDFFILSLFRTLFGVSK